MFVRIQKKLGIESLKGRITFIYVIFMFILSISVFGPLLVIGKKQLLINAKDEMSKAIHLQETIVSNWLNEHIIQLQTIADIPDVMDKDVAFIQNIMLKVKEHDKEFDLLAFANKEGIVEFTTSGTTNIDVSHRNYFKEAKKGNPYISDSFYGKITKDEIITISTPIFNQDNTFQGLFVGTIKLETLSRVMETYQDEHTETFILDQNGKMITSLGLSDNKDIIDSPIYQAAKKNQQVPDFYVAQDGEEVLGEYIWLNDHRWLIIGEISKNKIYALLIILIPILFTGFIILATFGFLIVMQLFKQIKEPIDNLLEGTRKIGQGNWKFRMQERHRDVIELKELNQNFNSMANLIESYVISIADREEKFRTIAEHSSDMISIHQSDGRFIYVSPAGYDILQYESNKIIGTTGLDYVHEEDVQYLMEQAKILKETGYVVMTFRLKRPTGEYIWLESSAKKSRFDDQQMEKIYVISRNVTERKRLEMQLKQANKLLENISTQDGLTGIYNRRRFDKDYQDMWHRSLMEQASITLLMIDVDYFKKYNDTFGHLAGDDCLIQIAKTIECKVEDVDGRVYRYGGEEFVVLITDIDATTAKQIAVHIRKSIENLEIAQKVASMPYVTISIGVNHMKPSLERNKLQFLTEADEALYEAKHKGRNRVIFYGE